MPPRSTGTPPLLRAPPFPFVDAAVSRMAGAQPVALGDIAALFAAIREARVGGAFWAPPAVSSAIVIRVKTADEIAPLSTALAAADRPRTAWLLPAKANRSAAQRAAGETAVLLGEIDPWSLLEGAERLLAHGDDEWAALAVIAGCPVEILSSGRFGKPGDSAETLRERAAADLASATYRDPFTGESSDIAAAIELLANWRRTLAGNRGIAAGCGFSWWKRHEIARFLWHPDSDLRLFRSEKRAIDHAAQQGGAVAVWPSRISAGMAGRAQAADVPLVRVEDGFIRSAGLGSNLVPPSSVAVDRLGIHYDPSRPSDLEALLAEAEFPPAVLTRAQQLRRVIADAGISKYGRNDDSAFPERQPDRRLVLVPGQVEDDMSVRLGGGGLCSNLELLRRARMLEPGAEIWFRPHPDVDAGHRKGLVREGDALQLADRIVRGGDMARLLQTVDGVHVLTSLTGFEALLRGRDVTCHGTPFYAGWGLTRDLAPETGRRGRLLTLDQLVAGVLILYPRYLDPVTGLPCPPEVLIRRIAQGAARNRLGWVTRLRRLQGWLTKGR